MPSLVAIREGKDKQVFTLSKATTGVGRSEESEIHIEDLSVSRNHAFIVHKEGKLVVHDNQSANGTFVNGQQISHSELKHRDVLRFGDCAFLVDLLDQHKPVVPPAQEIKVSLQTQFSAKQIQPLPPGKFSPQPERLVHLGHYDVQRHEPPHPKKQGLHIHPPSSHSSSPNALAWISCICGCMGLITFLPAIIIGHLADDDNEKSHKLRLVGLGLGYGFLALWAALLFWYFSKPQPALAPATSPTSPSDAGLVSTHTLTSPVISGAPLLLRDYIAWSPSEKARKIIMGKNTPTEILVAPVTLPGQSRDDLLKSYRLTWQHGLLLLEPKVLRVVRDEKNTTLIHFIMEDCFTPRNFWDYNSTMIPVKRFVFDGFYLPNHPNTYYERNPLLQAKVAKFNTDRFPWHHAERGINWQFEGMAENFRSDVSGLRWVAFIKPAFQTGGLILNTYEGDLVHDTPKRYNLSLYASTVVAEMVYMNGLDRPVDIHLDENLFSLEESKIARDLMISQFKTILKNRPTMDLQIPPVFKLSETPRPAQTSK